METKTRDAIGVDNNSFVEDSDQTPEGEGRSNHSNDRQNNVSVNETASSTIIPPERNLGVVDSMQCSDNQNTEKTDNSIETDSAPQEEKQQTFDYPQRDIPSKVMETDPDQNKTSVQGDVENSQNILNRKWQRKLKDDLQPNEDMVKSFGLNPLSETEHSYAYIFPYKCMRDINYILKDKVPNKVDLSLAKITEAIDMLRCNDTETDPI